MDLEVAAPSKLRRAFEEILTKIGQHGWYEEYDKTRREKSNKLRHLNEDFLTGIFAAILVMPKTAEANMELGDLMNAINNIVEKNENRN